jgi:hypothetical protein
MKKLTNPNFIYIATFITPFLVYTLEWSTIYPELTPQLFLFYLLTFAIAFFIGVLVDRLPPFSYKKIPAFKYNSPVILGLYVAYTVDCLYTGYLPLLAFSRGEISYGGSINYGIPTFHVILVTFSLFFALHLFHQFLSTRKLSLFVFYLSMFVPFIFLLQRSAIMYVIIASVFIFFISSSRMTFRRIAGLAVFMLAAIYMFGYLGNIRSANGDSTFIPKSSGVKEEFLESWVPNEFYWGYLYIASPVANLQNNINIEQDVEPNYGEFFIFEMTPDFLQKVLAEKLSLSKREFHQINSFLNVGTIYARPFSYLSWWGMLIIFAYLLLLMNLYYIIIKQSHMYGVTGIGMMFAVIAIANFENSIWFSAYSFPLIYPVLFSVVRDLQLKNRQRPRRHYQFSLQKTPNHSF